MAPLCSSVEVNLLIYHYLKESGFHHACFSLRHESRLDDSPLSREAIVEPGQLIRFLQKGLIYSAVEAHVQEDGSEKPCSAPFRLIGPPHVCDDKPRPPPPPASPVRLSPSPLPMFAQLKPSVKDAAVQTAQIVFVTSSNRTTNGIHSHPPSLSNSRRPSDDRDRSSKLASSSKKMLNGDTQVKPRSKDSASSSNKIKDSKRKAPSSSTLSSEEREDKRAKRQGSISEKARTVVNGTLNSDEPVERGRHVSTSKRNGDSASRATSSSPERKVEGQSKDRDLVKKKKSSKSESVPSRKTDGKREASGRPDKDSSQPSSAKDTKSSESQPKGDNYVQDDHIALLSGHTGQVFVSAWNPTVPNMLASGAGDATVRIWDLPQTPRDPVEAPTICKHLPATQSKDISTLDWNPDGTLLASGSYDGIVRLWTPQGDLHLVMSMHQGPVICVRWNRKGNMLLTGSADGTAIVWDLGSGKPRQQFPLHSDSVLDVGWLSCSAGSLSSLPATTPGAPSLPPPMPHGLSPSVADTMFATCSADNSINICKLGEPRPIRSFKGHTDEVNAIRFDPSQTLLASVSDDGTAKIWALELGGNSASGSGGAASSADHVRKRGSRGRGGSANVEGMDLDDDPPHGRADETGDRDREKDRATPTSNSATHHHTTKEGPTLSATPTASSSSAAPAKETNPAHAITTTAKGPNKGLRLTLTGHKKELYAVAWCPTGPGSENPDQPRMLATTSFDWTARLWNADSGDCIRVIDAHQDNVYTVCFSPCARYLATGGIDKKVLVTRVDNGGLVKQYVGGGAIFDLSWNCLPGSESAATTNGDSTEGDKKQQDTSSSNNNNNKNDETNSKKEVVKSPLLDRLAISQADRKLVVLHLPDLDKVKSNQSFGAPIDEIADNARNNVTKEKKPLDP